MRVVRDTHTLVSGVISPAGPPRRRLDGARAQAFELCTSATLLGELLDVFSREKLVARLTQAGLTPQGIVADLRRLATLTTPQQVPRVVENDADEDHVLACALAAQADLIVSGDRHPLSLGGRHQSIPIVSPAKAIAIIGGK